MDSFSFSAMAKRSRINFFNKNIFIFMILFAFSIRAFLAYYSTFNFTFLRNVVSNDAVGFHILAQNLYYDFSIANMIELFDYNLYPLILGFFYKMTFVSHFNGNLLSVLIWLHSFFIILKILKYFQFSNLSIFYSMLYFSISPTIIMFSSVSLRDIFVFYSLLNIIFLYLKFLSSKELKYIIIIFCFLFIVYKLHHNLLYLLLGITLLSYFFIYFSKVFEKYIKMRKVNFFILIILLLILLDSFNLYNFNYILYHINNFQKGSLAESTIGRANYVDAIFYLENIYDLLLYIVRNYTLYILEPSFLNLKDIKLIDTIVIIENLFKIYIIIMFLLLVLNSNYIKQTRDYLIILIFFMFLTVDISFSIGTFNWGTAFRHQVISFGLIPFFIAYIYERLLNYDS